MKLDGTGRLGKDSLMRRSITMQICQPLLGKINTKDLGNKERLMSVTMETRMGMSVWIQALVIRRILSQICVVGTSTSQWKCSCWIWIET